MGSSYVEQNTITGLDIGTSRVLASAGVINTAGEVEVVGVGYAPSRGLNRGVVVDIDAAAKSIRQAIDNLELVTPDCGEIRGVYAGLTGEHVESYNAQGVVVVGDREVTADDIDRALDPAQVVSTRKGRKRNLHIIPQEYIVDDQRGVKEPQGMLGGRLEARVHVVTCDANIARNLEKCINHADLELKGLMLNPLAASDTVLTEEEKNLGTCLIDIGAGISDIVVFTEGTVKYTSVMPLAGREVSNDIALGLQIPVAEAEEIKLKYGTAFSKVVPAGEILHIERPNNKEPASLDRALLSRIIEARYAEMLEFIRCLLVRTGYEENLAAGIVLTGGGACIEGLKLLAESVFRRQVRIAAPDHVKGLRNIVDDPAYSASVGLMMQGVIASRGSLKRRPIGPLYEFQQWIAKYF